MPLWVNWCGFWLSAYFLRFPRDLVGDFWNFLEMTIRFTNLQFPESILFYLFENQRTLVIPQALLCCHLEYCIGVLHLVPPRCLSHLPSIIHRALRYIQLKFTLYLISILGLKWFLVTVNNNLNSFGWHSMPLMICPLLKWPLSSPAISS